MSMAWAEVRRAIVREFQHIRADRMSLSLLFMLPVVQLLLFGFAIRPETQRTTIALAVASAERAEQIEKIIRGDARFALVATRLPPGGAEAAVRSGRALVGIEVPKLADFDDEEPQAPVRVIADMSNPAATGSGLLSLESAYWKRIAHLGPAQNVAALRVEIVKLYNSDLRSAWAFTPGLIGVAIMISMLIFGAMSAPRWRDANDSAQSRLQLWSAMLILYPVLALGQALLVLLLAHWLFGLALPPASFALLLIVPFYAAGHVALGLALASVTEQPLQAVQATVSYYFPAMILSGFLYPFEFMPRWAQQIGEVLPLTHFIRAARDGLLRQRGAMDVLAHGAAMALFLVAMLAALALLSRRALTQPRA